MRDTTGCPATSGIQIAGSNLVGVEAGGEDGGTGVSGVSSLSIAKGCSLVPERDRRRIPAFAGMTDPAGMTGLTAIPPFAIILIITLAAPVAVRVMIKRR